ncbi:MAG TPA: DUF4476 domain-containing protein [Spirochaetota bacterium]|nr:DUF4476 domain-containing protein [Spirochaetota bacterium]
MKFKIIITVLFVALSLNVFAKEMMLRTDEGSITVDITEVKDGKIKSDQLIAILKSRIDKLEYEYISRLGSLERAEALKELKSIRILIAAFPRNADVAIDEMKKEQSDADRKEMPDSDFKLLVDNIKVKKFSREKVSVIKMAAENNYFSLNQLLELFKQFRNTDTNELVDTIKAVYPKVTDKKNKYLLFDYFKFQSDKDRVKKIVDDIDKK